MSTTAPRHLLLVGGGLMGCGIAAIFLAGGWRVQVVTPSAATRAGLPGRVADALAQLDAKVALEDRLTIQSCLDAADTAALDLVIEAVSEDLALKQSLFRALDARVPPNVPLATNTSTFPIGQIADGLTNAARVVGAHFFMPAHLVPLVEVILGPQSDPALAAQVSDWLRTLGKRPILVQKDIPGFIANRIQHAMMREALYLIEDGVASAEDVDAAVRYGFGFRFIACGPILQKEMSGWDTNCRAGNALYPHLNNADCFPPALERMVNEGRVGMKSLNGLWSWTAASAADTQAGIGRRLQAGLAVLREDGEA
jgi:3-hydroxybutyryl-CoA dehydrogenase